MDGLIYVIDELGRGLATLKAENAQLRADNETLRTQLAQDQTKEP